MAGQLAIHVNGLSFAYAGGPEVLHDLRFEISAEETVGLIGPNGAGKTTLFLTCCGVLPIATGMVSVAGLDPAIPRDRAQLPTQVGIVFQDSDDQLVNATVLDDVAFGPLNLSLSPDEVRRRVNDALEHVGLKGFEQRVPHHLSGGEKRRVALAGVLAMRPAIVLLDEPTMFLDPRGRRELAEFLNTWPSTKVVATHDLEFVLATCRRVLLLESGRLCADGPAREVLSDASLMDKHGLEVPHSLRK